jgi:predicted nuclease with TOPRIM domain
MPKLTEQAIKGLNALRGAEFKPLLEYWRQCLRDTTDMMTAASDSWTVARLQGRVQELKERLEQIEKAESILEKFQKY